MKALNGFLKTQKQMTLKDVCGYIMLKKLHRPRMSAAFLADTVDMI